ncbi:unnamed protein product [Linum tenue]|uniref:Uncharacterized protein n=1 Tax=Linum tenue TaxID=586396 RepID=A0AAV0JWW8_9ROSI|nr:unnamed protein product [Linum tenue]
MRITNPPPRLPLILLLLIILPPDLSSCTSRRHLRSSSRDVNSDEIKQTDRQMSSSSPSWSATKYDFPPPPAEAPRGSRARDRVYGASYRTVPAGPNPLHN